MMDERSLLLSKVDALLEQLDWAQSSLSRARLEPQISDAASTGFKRLFHKRREELTQLRRSLENAEPHGSVWNELNRYSTSCRELFQECLGFLGGAMLRDINKEDDICEVADALLKELSIKAAVQWGGVSVLAESHFYTETTGLVRLRFPDYGIWTLPIAVHELGHFVGPRISDGAGFPFRARLDSMKNYGQDQEISHTEELFSDLFAVYALGPAYACACIVLSFDPEDDLICEDGLTHPSHAKRVCFILEALEQMSKTEDNIYQGVIQVLRGLWERILKTAEHDNCLDRTSIPALKYQLQELYPIVSPFKLTLRYNGWKRAADLSEELPLEGDAAGVLKKNNSLADVLNAVWIWRLQQTADNSNSVHRVNKDAISLCREIMVRHGHQLSV